MHHVAIFDFLSHEFMHHPFNEGYLRMLRAAFPKDRISFHAGPGHLDVMAARFSPADGIEFRPCPPFSVPFGLSRHNPVAGRWGARRALNAMIGEMGKVPLRMAAVLGVDANLYGVLASRWTSLSSAPLHMILHNHLAAGIKWRSRNPLIRNFDFVAGLKKPLPPPVRLITLELGINEAIADRFPALARSTETLEHPILESEWCAQSPMDSPGVKIAFLGHSSAGKGFDLFAELARKCRRPDLEFQAIGIADPASDQFDQSGLTRKPSRRSVPRPEYIAALAEVDLVCLPLSDGYEYVASGSVIDAMAALKPLVCIKNRSLSAIEKRYGPIGYMAASASDLSEFICNLTRSRYDEHKGEWIRNLTRLREARHPEVLALGYKQLVGC
jgi:glycosyltransferase involved in cell wall biosynthesis